jgi:DNA-binding transcriptional ArsR family regulator
MALQGGELCICQIIALLELAPSTVSKHMSILKQAGLVKSRKEGRWIYYCRAESSKVPVKAIVTLLSKMLADDTIVKNDSDILSTIITSDRSDLCLQQKSSKNISDA